MGKEIIKSFIIILFLISGFVSCKKGSDNNTNVSPNTKLLVEQEWKLSKSEEKINSDPYTDHFPGFPACTQDDKYSFKINGTYELNEGVIKCDPSSPQIISTGVWHFASNETKIDIDGTESVINQLDNSLFIISSSYISNPDTNYFRYTFVH